MPLHDSNVLAMVYSHDLEALITASQDTTIRVHWHNLRFALPFHAFPLLFHAFSLPFHAFSLPFRAISLLFHAFSLCLSVPAFFCLLAGCCLASIISACLLVCFVLASVPFWLADCPSGSVCLSVCPTCVSVCHSVSACLMVSLYGGCLFIMLCVKQFRLQPVLVTLCSCHASSMDTTLHLMMLLFPS